MTARLPAAVLWDMDGTLVDSEPYWMAEEHALAQRHGGRWSHEDALDVVGLALLDSAALIVQRTGIALTPEQVVTELVDGVCRRLAEGVPWRPGAQGLLARLRAAGVRTALVTMSYRSLTDALERALPAGSFDVIVPGDEVVRGKPHPEPYLRAAQLLGLPAAECVAIEDSEAGARSAAAAGARTVVVPHVKAVPQLPGTVQIPTLEGLTPAELLIVAQSAPRPQPTRGQVGQGR
jgi:HAD superfamily hydrolase (TIGR01509 family)